MIQKINNLINSEYKALIAEKEAKLSYLQAQMDPHFLFNSLEALRMIAEVDDNIRVSDGLFSLGKVLKAHIHTKTMTWLEEEIDIVNCYVNVQNLRFGGRIHLETCIQEGLGRIEAPALTLQPLVENAILHGFKFKSADCRIKITAEAAEGDDVTISVRDNGVGFDCAALCAINGYIATGANRGIPSNGNGIALINLHERIKLYYGGRYGLSISSGPNLETRVSITLARKTIYNTADTSPCSHPSDASNNLPGSGAPYP